jgi:hypothetical protein
MRLRELGPVPWWWIEDESRDVREPRYAASVYEYVVETVPRARIDCWGGEPPPLIICEARATRGVVERIADEYLTATGGQCGDHIVNEIVPLLAGNKRKVLYIGDCEVEGPGDQIEANTRHYIEEHTGRTFTPLMTRGGHRRRVPERCVIGPARAFPDRRMVAWLTLIRVYDGREAAELRRICAPGVVSSYLAPGP